MFNFSSLLELIVDIKIVRVVLFYINKFISLKIFDIINF